MEVLNEKKEDKQMLTLLHLSQLLYLVTGIGGFVVPLIIWLTKKDEIHQMDEQGKEVINFQISLFIYYIIGVILLVVLVGFLVLGAAALMNLIFPIIYGIKANNGDPTRYPLTIRFIK